jgi:hypothetical protein
MQQNPGWVSLNFQGIEGALTRRTGQGRFKRGAWKGSLQRKGVRKLQESHGSLLRVDDRSAVQSPCHVEHVDCSPTKHNALTSIRQLLTNAETREL